ncbi:MAG: HRDC domain-containing protein [Nitriliruptoraceae bacterium]|nr:HRDC domain-containing protein [Nitriliruptoraceae bacterium]
MADEHDTPAVAFVDDPTRVRDALRSVDGPVVGVDVERADSDRYYRRAALVQVGVAGHCVLLDGVTIDTMDGLDEFLGPDRLAVLHAIENDLAPLHAKGVDADRVADTAVAAALLGLPTGLGPLLNELLDVELPGDKSAFQRADWEARPLSEGMAAYAAGDVVHLPALWARLEEQLEDTGRRRWYEEEFAAVIAKADQDQRSWTRVKSIGRLTPQQRAIVRTVWEVREQLSRTHDIAPNRLLHDDAIVAIAQDPPRTVPQLIRRSRRRRAPLREHAPTLLEAVGAGLEAEPEPKDTSRRWSDEDRTIHDALRQRRKEVAADVGIDAGILCPSKPLWSAIAAEPEDGAALCAAAELRAWQTELLAAPLWDAYEQARASARPAAPEDAAAATSD